MEAKQEGNVEPKSGALVWGGTLRRAVDLHPLALSPLLSLSAAVAMVTI